MSLVTGLFMLHSLYLSISKVHTPPDQETWPPVSESWGSGWWREVSREADALSVWNTVVMWWLSYDAWLYDVWEIHWSEADWRLQAAVRHSLSACIGWWEAVSEAEAVWWGNHCWERPSWWPEVTTWYSDFVPLMMCTWWPSSLGSGENDSYIQWSPLQWHDTLLNLRHAYIRGLSRLCAWLQCLLLSASAYIHLWHSLLWTLSLPRCYQHSAAAAPPKRCATARKWRRLKASVTVAVGVKQSQWKCSLSVKVCVWNVSILMKTVMRKWKLHYHTQIYCLFPLFPWAVGMCSWRGCPQWRLWKSTDLQCILMMRQ